MASTEDTLDVICQLLRCVQADGRQVSKVLLEEKDPKAKLKKLRITALEPGILLLATDAGRTLPGANQRSACTCTCMSPLFQQDGCYDQNRACDAVLLRKVEQGFEVCYIELKSDSPHGYEGQFKSTQCFMRYVVAWVSSICGYSCEIVRERFVVFHTDPKGGVRRASKTTTRFLPRAKNTASNPEKYIVRSGDSVRLTEFF